MKYARGQKHYIHHLATRINDFFSLLYKNSKRCGGNNNKQAMSILWPLLLPLPLLPPQLDYVLKEMTKRKPIENWIIVSKRKQLASGCLIQQLLAFASRNAPHLFRIEIDDYKIQN